MSDKFHQNLCAANINASQLRAIGEILSLAQDDLPRDSAQGLGDLVAKLAREILAATAGMEEAQGEEAQAA